MNTMEKIGIIILVIGFAMMFIPPTFFPVCSQCIVPKWQLISLLLGFFLLTMGYATWMDGVHKDIPEGEDCGCSI